MPDVDTMGRQRFGRQRIETLTLNSEAECSLRGQEAPLTRSYDLESGSSFEERTIASVDHARMVEGGWMHAILDVLTARSKSCHII